MSQKLPDAFLERLRSVTGKRPKTVIDFILEHGSISTEQLQELGYDHPPRAVRDVRELGIPIKTNRVRSERTGRVIASYTFGDPSELVAGLEGRTAISRRFKDALIAEQGTKCEICGLTFEHRYLQVDHRVPVEIGGDDADEDRNVANYMLLDGGCNRAKSWSCEHCPNVQVKDVDLCKRCYWASPRDYEHVATVLERRLDIVWRGDEVPDYVDLALGAEDAGTSLPNYVKDQLRSS